MRWLSRLVRRKLLEKQLDAELRDHVDRQVAERAGSANQTAY